MTSRATRTGLAKGLLLGALVVLVVAPLPLGAQETDSRWLAWMGCWQPADGGVEAVDAMLCFRSVSSGVGVEMISVENGEIADRQTVWADGQTHETALEGCVGWDRGDFASQRGRVYLSSEHVCEGGVERTSTGLFAMVSSEEWVDVKVVEVGGQSVPWVMRYRLATQSAADAAGLGDIAAGMSMAVRSARVAASAPPAVADVIEASQYVAEEGVQAWIAERNSPLALDANQLIRMADAGVSEEVIDVVVAVSYPSHFAVDRDADEYGRYGPMYGGSYGRWGYYDPFYGSLFYSPFGYNRYGYGGGYGGYGGYYRPTIVVVDRADTGGGRVINGSGYAPRSSGSGRTARRANPSSGGTTRSAGSRGSTGSSMGSSRGGGASRTGSSTGRTARRRGGGL